jgi:hypothetical protein
MQRAAIEEPENGGIPGNLPEATSSFVLPSILGDNSSQKYEKSLLESISI